MPDPDTLICHTKRWLLEVVIGHGLCPFAKAEYDSERIHYEVVEAAGPAGQLTQVVAQCKALDAVTARETSLLIFPSGVSAFIDFLDLVERANRQLMKSGYEGVYQLASFHPSYLFADSGDDDPSNYTNRSPYPMLHILREASVEAALATYPNPENIPNRNIQLTQTLGLAVMQDLLAQCVR